MSWAIWLFRTIVAGIFYRQMANPKKEETENVQEFRKALDKGDSNNIDAAVADQHDRVRQALRGRKR
jgi:hypothetical protein